MSTNVNPYTPPPVPPQGPFPPVPFMPPQPEYLKDDLLRIPWQMNYTGAFEMIHRRPDWLGNAFLAGLCYFIPIVGPIVVFGYSFECAETLNRTRGSFYPRFDFNRFTELLLRGLGPFLVYMLASVVFVPVAMLMYFGLIGSVIGAAAVAENGGEGAAAAVFFGVLLAIFVIVMGVSILSYFFLLPMALRGGMASDVGQAFQFGWAADFAKRMWKEMLMAWLLQFGLSIVVTVLGMVTCYVGFLPGVTYMMLVNSWICFQLYRVFLHRGGAPIPFKPLPYPLPMPQ